MSRIGKLPIALPKGVEVKTNLNEITIKGPKGSLSRKIHDSMQVKVEGTTVTVVPRSKSKLDRKYYGLTRTLVSNMVDGVSKGFSKSLTLVGVGYRAQMKGKEVSMSLGYSHPVDFKPPPGIDLAVDKQTTVIVSGADKELVGRVAANIRSFRLPEPYHGKGVRYADEHIITKVGKSGGKS